VLLCSNGRLLSFLSFYPSRSPLPQHPPFSHDWFLAGSVFCSAVEGSDTWDPDLLAWYLGSLLYASRLVWPHSMPSTCPFLLHRPQNPARNLTPTLHHCRSISYDDHSNCSHMPMLTKFMTCIFPPSYFLFLFVCVLSIYSYIHLFHPPTCVPTYLRLYFVSVLALQPSLSRLAFCAIFMFISHSLPSTHTSVVPHLVINFPTTRRFRSDNPHSHSPFSHSHSTLSLATKNKRIYLSDILFPQTHISSSYSIPLPYGTACLLARLLDSYLHFFSFSFPILFLEVGTDICLACNPAYFFFFGLTYYT